MICHVIIFANTKIEIERLDKFLDEHEGDYKFIRDYKRASHPKTGIWKLGGVYSCKTEKAQFMIRLQFEGRDYVV